MWCVLLTVVAAMALTCAPAAQARKHHPRARHGGHVHKAWPQTRAHRPRNHLTRSLARQVGKGRPRRRHHSRTLPTVPASLAHAAATGVTKDSAKAFTEAPSPSVLSLVRSFDIPPADPAYDRLLNLSFTYDSAVATVAFVSGGARDQAERLLDQLAALQHKDGSLATVYDTSTGAEVPTYRSGTIAWVGLAAVAYEHRYHTGRYERLAQSAADWLMEQSDPESDLLRGGPDVKWVSTQHNILAYFLLRDLSDLKAKTDAVAGAQADDGEAANTIGDGIKHDLLVDRFTGSEHLTQGLDDPVQPLDVQPLGAAFLAACGCMSDARTVLVNAVRNFVIDDRSIGLSKRSSTFNMSFESDGPFIGFRPYLDEGSPDVLWMEGTAEMVFMLDRFGYDTGPLRDSISSWIKLTDGSDTGLLGSDRTVTGNRFNEYHVWPTSAATSWWLIAQHGDDDFLAAG
jgi:hypothetical protein